VPIRPFLSDQAFQPETIRNMSTALERVCAALGLTMRGDPATRLIATKIIEMAQRSISELVLKEFDQREHDRRPKR
jgi:hypothetical protein